MNKPNKFVETLTDAEYNQLMENYQRSDNFRVRQRSHAIILSHQRYEVDKIAEICGVHRTTVCTWISSWKNFGQQGLPDEQRSGRPPILSVTEQAQAIEIGLRNPKFPARQLKAVKAETGKQISSFTMKRLLKKRLSVEAHQVGTVEKSGCR